MSSSPSFAPPPGGRGDGLRVAAVQMNSGGDKAANLETALGLIDRAAASGARLVALPEVWSYLGPDAGNRASAETIPGPTIDRLADRARRHGMYLHAGSIFEVEPGDPRLFNTTAVLDPDGNVIARYRKIHLFDVVLDGVATYQESATVSPGDDVVVVDIDGMPVGLAICYDLRFPELFRILALNGAEAIVLPAAFTKTTGKDHWEVLLRARAIENGVFVVAPAQVGRHEPGNWCFGRSAIVDPWGTVMTTAPDAETFVLAQLNRALVRQVRCQIPSLANRQPERYPWPTTDGALADGAAVGRLVTR